MSEGELVGSEDLEGDFNGSKMEALERENPEGDQEEGMVEFTVEVDQMREHKVFSDQEIDPVRKKGELKTGATR